jgi:hypothetical protein
MYLSTILPLLSLTTLALSTPTIHENHRGAWPSFRCTGVGVLLGIRRPMLEEGRAL